MSGDVPPEAAAELDKTLDDMAHHASESANEWAVAIKQSLTTALNQKYNSDALAKDVAAFWARSVRDSARGWTDLAKLAAAIAALPSKPPEPSHGSTDSGSEA
jgi:hypothetical protein